MKKIEIVGVAGDYDELIAGAEEAAPQVLVTDIRMPPTFQSEGIDAAKQLRKRHPGTGVVVLSQFDDPEYAVSLLADGAAGYAYLLKDRVAEGDQLARAVREVATGGSVLDPKIVESLVAPVTAIFSIPPCMTNEASRSSGLGAAARVLAMAAPHLGSGSAEAATGKLSLRSASSGMQMSEQTRKWALALISTVEPGLAEAGTSIGTGR